MKPLTRNVAVILAGGVGERAGFNRPKQLVVLSGKPIIAHTIEQFQRSPCIDEIVIVSHRESLLEIEGLVNSEHLDKVSRVLLGGEERYQSSIAAIRACQLNHFPGRTNLLFHDAVRPMVSQRIIDEVVKALESYTAVDVAIQSPDTIVKIETGSCTITQVPSRKSLRLGQTPQGFALETIAEAYRLAEQDPEFRTTDDCGVVVKYLPTEPVFVVQGDPYNIKLTHEIDLLTLEKFMQHNARRRITASRHKTVESLAGHTIVIFGGTSGIGLATAETAKRRGASVHVGSRRTGVDVSSPEQVAGFLGRIKGEDAGIDAVINCAGQLTKRPLLHMSPEEIAGEIAVNLLGAITIARESHPFLRATSGTLVLIGSSSYSLGRANYATYGSTKAAIANLTQALAEEWLGDGIRVNCIIPPRTRTPMRTLNFGHEPQSSLAEPELVAEYALAVATSSETGFIFDLPRP